MRIYPVLDLKQGRVVHAVRGERASYAPVASRLAPPSCGASPIEVARAFRRVYGLRELYLADLDAIAGEGAPGPARSTYGELREDGFRLLVDAGVRSGADGALIHDLGAERVVAALETLPSPEALDEVVREIGVKAVVFGLDLRDGAPLARGRDWPSGPEDVVERAVDSGVTEVIVLDLADVGASCGPRRLELCRALRRRFGSSLRITAGGGIRHAGDLEALAAAGAGGALVATALHDGSISRHDVARCERIGNREGIEA